MLDLCTSTKHRANDNPVTMFPLFAKDRRAKLPYRAPVGALAASGMSAVRSATVRAMRVMVGEVLVRGVFARHPTPGLGGVRGRQPRHRRFNRSNRKLARERLQRRFGRATLPRTPPCEKNAPQSSLETARRISEGWASGKVGRPI